MNINHISVSRSEIYRTCAQKYKYRYHLKVIPEGPEQIYFTYGKIIHKIAEVFVDRKGESLITEVASEVLQRKIEIQQGQFASELPTEYKRKMPDHLRAIKTLTDKLGFEGKTEFPFDLDLDPPHKKIFTGVIDRLIIKNNFYCIVDYKTTKKGIFRKTGSELTSDLQLRAYARYVQNTYKAKAEDIHAALYYVDGPEFVGVRFTQQALDKAQETLLKNYNDIVKHDAATVVGNVGKHCKNCEFNNICPFYSSYAK